MTCRQRLMAEVTTLRAELLEARTDATLRLEAMRTLRAELDAARLERDEIREDDAACRAALASEHERAERAEKVLATVYAAVDEQGGYLHDANGNLAKAVSAVGKDLRFNIEKRTAAEAAWKDDEAKGMEREASLDAALSTSHAEVERLREALEQIDTHGSSRGGWWAASKALEAIAPSPPYAAPGAPPKEGT